MIKRFTTIAALTVMLAGCQSLGITVPTTFNGKMAVAIGTVTTIRQTADQLLLAGRITPQDAANVETQTDNAEAALQIARNLSGTDMTSAQNKLQSTLTILQATETYLESKK